MDAVRRYLTAGYAQLANKLITAYAEKIMNFEDIVKLWYKTQMGNIHECKKNQLIFADIMWTLHENLKEEE